eukprot:6741994-Pyramimonas_sp.AAC.3
MLLCVHTRAPWPRAPRAKRSPRRAGPPRRRSGTRARRGTLPNRGTPPACARGPAPDTPRTRPRLPASAPALFTIIYTTYGIRGVECILAGRYWHRRTRKMK